MPDWRFAVVAIQDPYEPAGANDQQIPAGMRMVAYQVILTNNSAESMDFTISDVRLRDIDGFEYRGGERIGDEPRLSSQNLPGGDRIRGWVWYLIPEATVPTSIVLVAPEPRLRIRLDEPNDFHEKAIEQSKGDILPILAEWFDGIREIRLHRDEASTPVAEKPKRVTDEMVRAERLNGLRRRDATLDAAIEVLDLEIVE
jgi:hypothetical protein